MCCFSGRVEHVESTKIFARRSTPGHQMLVYQMSLTTSDSVAMILPLPTVTPSPTGAVRFISLEGYWDFFDDVARAIPKPAAVDSMGASHTRETIIAVPVGDYVASFVPSLRDFSRLDPQFRLPEGSLDAVPEYADWGFAVFQLRSTEMRLTDAHPMAFEFTTRRRDALFFPTVHVHDGTMHATANFSHQLYAQGIAGDGWLGTGAPLGQFVDESRASGLIDAGAGVFSTAINGVQPNRDVWVPLA